MQHKKSPTKTNSLILATVIIFLVAYYVYFYETPFVQNLPYNNLFFFLNKFNNNKSSTTNNNHFNPTFQSYWQLHNSIVKNRSQQRVVFYEAQLAYGYGNRIYSLLSAFMVAVLSDSALLIKWPFIDQFIDCPLDDTFKNFTDSSFLDFSKKQPTICNINTRTQHTWNQTKLLKNLPSIE